MSEYFDRRARLGPTNIAMSRVLGPNECGNVLKPLYATRGLMFPYTPDVVFIRNANYNDFHFTHSNYRFNQYQNSGVNEIQVTGEFSVQSEEEGRYLIAAIRFLQSVTMSEFGLSTPLEKRGTPPPVLRFNYLGEQMFRNVPVVVSMVSFNFDRSIDYVPITLASNESTETRLSVGQRLPDGTPNMIATGRASSPSTTYVPTKMLITTTLLLQPNPKKIRDNFSVRDFKTGKLVREGYI